MKAIKTYEQYLNESIEIIKVYSDDQSNQVSKLRRLTDKEIDTMLSNPDEWITDDDVFHLKNGKKVYADELEGKTVIFKNKNYKI